MNPYYESILNEDGTPKCKKVHVMYVDGDGPKLCDGCDEQKEELASIRMICGDVACICQQCIKDILTIWDEDRNQ